MAKRLGWINVAIAVCIGAFVEAGVGAETWLLDLAKKDFNDVSSAEEKLFLAITDDTFADYRDPNNEAINDPNKAEEWGPERTLRADRIEWAWARSKVQRIALQGARIEGQPGLGRNKTTGVLGLIECYAPKGILLNYARISSLSLEGTRCGHIMAQGIIVDKTVSLAGVRVTDGGVNLVDAEVGANLNLNGAYVENSSGYALIADRSKVGANFSMSGGFVAVGAVSLNSARIDGQLNCMGGEFNNERGRALNAERVEVKKGINLREGFVARGEVHLTGAYVGENVTCSGGRFINPNGLALMLQRVRVDGDLHLGANFRAEGEVRVAGAQVAGTVVCLFSRFVNPGGMAIYGSGMTIGGNALMRGCAVNGSLNLQNSIIEGQLEFTNCALINGKDHDAIVGEGMDIKKNLYVIGLMGGGAVRLSGAKIGGILRWQAAPPSEFSLDLRDASIGTLWDERESWPTNGRLFLHGFVYDGIYDKATIRVDERLDWLHRQPDDRYRAQPYEQLAKVLRESGHDEAAKQILIAKVEERLRLTSMARTTRFLWWLWGWLMDYGYHPLHGVRVVLYLILPGWFFFWLAKRADYIRPCQKWAYKNGRRSKVKLVKEYPPFNGLLYSIEVFIPAINLQYMAHWLPKCPDTEGKRFAIRAWARFCYSCLWFWIIFEIISGWVIAAMLIAGATLLIRS